MLKKKKPEQPVLAKPPEEDKTCGSGTTSTYGYKVQARVQSYVPERAVVINGPHEQKIILTEDWRTVEFAEGFNPAGVPSCNSAVDNGLLRQHYLLPHESAVALAYTLAAQNAQYTIGAVRIRLVKYKLQSSYKMWREDEKELTDHFSDIDKMMVKHRDEKTA